MRPDIHTHTHAHTHTLTQLPTLGAALLPSFNGTFPTFDALAMAVPLRTSERVWGPLMPPWLTGEWA